MIKFMAEKVFDPIVEHLKELPPGVDIPLFLGGLVCFIVFAVVVLPYAAKKMEINTGEGTGIKDPLPKPVGGGSIRTPKNEWEAGGKTPCSKCAYRKRAYMVLSIPLPWWKWECEALEKGEENSINPVTGRRVGVPITRLCIDMRSDKGLCGHEGKLFKEKK